VRSLLLQGCSQAAPARRVPIGAPAAPGGSRCTCMSCTAFAATPWLLSAAYVGWASGHQVGRRGSQHSVLCYSVK
jgi:hypothetical protein